MAGLFSRLITYNRDNHIDLCIKSMNHDEIKQYNNDSRLPNEFQTSRIKSINTNTHVLFERTRKPPITNKDDFDNNVKDLVKPNKFENFTLDELRGYMTKHINNPSFRKLNNQLNSSEFERMKQHMIIDGTPGLDQYDRPHHFKVSCG